MTRSLILVLGVLIASLGACSRQSAAPTSTQGAAEQAPAQTNAASAPAAGAATLANAPAGSPGAAPGGSEPTDGSDDAPVGTTSLEKIAELPSQHQLPDG